MTTYIAKIKHGFDDNSITTIQLEAESDAAAYLYLRRLAMMLETLDFTLIAREDREVEL